MKEYCTQQHLLSTSTQQSSTTDKRLGKEHSCMYVSLRNNESTTVTAYHCTHSISTNMAILLRKVGLTHISWSGWLSTTGYWRTNQISSMWSCHPISCLLHRKWTVLCLVFVQESQYCLLPSRQLATTYRSLGMKVGGILIIHFAKHWMWQEPYDKLESAKSRNVAKFITHFSGQ